MLLRGVSVSSIVVFDYELKKIMCDEKCNLLLEYYPFKSIIIGIVVGSTSFIIAK